MKDLPMCPLPVIGPSDSAQTSQTTCVDRYTVHSRRSGPCAFAACVMAWAPGWARYMLGLRLAPAYVPSPACVGKSMLTLAELRRGETIVDLGCGDGRLLRLAVSEFGAARAVGYEVEGTLARTAQTASIDDTRVVVHQKSAFEAEACIASADVVTLYLTESGNESVLPMLRRALRRPGARVVSYVWGMGSDLPPSRTAKAVGEGVVLGFGKPNVLLWCGQLSLSPCPPAQTSYLDPRARWRSSLAQDT